MNRILLWITRFLSEHLNSTIYKPFSRIHEISSTNLNSIQRNRTTRNLCNSNRVLLSTATQNKNERKFHQVERRDQMANQNNKTETMDKNKRLSMRFSHSFVRIMAAPSDTKLVEQWKWPTINGGIEWDPTYLGYRKWNWIFYRER